MAGIGQQRQRTGPPAAHDFRDHHARGQYNGDQQFALAPADSRVMGMLVVMLAGMAVRVIHTTMLEIEGAVTQSP
jgi:hypothetical protein